MKEGMIWATFQAWFTKMMEESIKVELIWTTYANVGKVSWHIPMEILIQVYSIHNQRDFVLLEEEKCVMIRKYGGMAILINLSLQGMLLSQMEIYSEAMRTLRRKKWKVSLKIHKEVPLKGVSKMGFQWTLPLALISKMVWKL
jgi:hypothetical protein